MACHTRSTSLPTSSHPFVLKAEEELKKLKVSVASSPSLSYEIMLDAIKAVGHVYECISDLLCMSSIRNDLSLSTQRRFVDQELEESIRLIDVCSTSRDNLDSIKGQLQDLESALRRGEYEDMRTTIRNYILSVKKANKDAKKSVITKKSESTLVDSSIVVVLLLEVREVTISLLQSLFSFLPKQIFKQKTSKWPGVSRLLQKSGITCKEAADVTFDISSLSLKIEGLENELEILFRHVVKCRVSLLNICSF
jgi:Arabidopsis protein of unknown function